MFSQRIVAISGASAGIGESLLKEFVKYGAKVIANGRRKEKLEDVVNKLASYRSQIRSVVGDIAEEKTVEEIFARSKSEFGRYPDTVVVNAGRGLVGSLLESDLKQWQNLIETNIYGASLLMRQAASKMLEMRKNNFTEALDIIVVGSCVGNFMPMKSSLYSATKFAVNSLAESLRRELCSFEIRVSLISPGLTKTDFRHAVPGYNDPDYDKTEQQYGTLIKGDDIARSILFIASQPKHVHLHRIDIRTTRQDYP